VPWLGVRRGGRHFAAAAPSRLERLLSDVDESVRKTGEDAELVFAQLYDYDHRLEASLGQEVALLNRTRTKLVAVQAKYRSQVDRSSRKAQLLDKASRAKRAMLKRFKALVPKNGAASPGRPSKALLQLQARQQRLSSRAAKVTTMAALARSAKTEGERKIEELACSADFTEAALEADREFLGKVEGHVRAKAEIVEAIRGSRQAQLTTLSDLVDLLKGSYNAAPAEQREPAALAPEQGNDGASPQEQGEDGDTAAEPALSLVQLGAEKPPWRQTTSALQVEIEDALQKKRDTHAILLRVKAALDREAPIDAKNVRSAVVKLGNALHVVSSGKQFAEDARQRCEAHESGLDAEGKLRRNLRLLAASQNYTGAAVKATQRNLKAILAKSQDLNRSSEEFTKLMGRAMKALDAQSHDRATITMAVRKAVDVAPRLTKASAASATVALLQQLTAELGDQETKERAYRAQQTSMQEDFNEYTRGYATLLQERKLRYKSSVSALELYATELASDIALRSATLANGADLGKAGQELCDSVLAFYKRHDQRRTELSKALRATLPMVPGALGDAVSGSA